MKKKANCKREKGANPHSHIGSRGGGLERPVLTLCVYVYEYVRLLVPFMRPESAPPAVTSYSASMTFAAGRSVLATMALHLLRSTRGAQTPRSRGRLRAGERTKNFYCLNKQNVSREETSGFDGLGSRATNMTFVFTTESWPEL